MVKVIYETDPISSTLIMHAANQKKKRKKYINSYVHAIKKKQKVNQPITSIPHLIKKFVTN